MFLFYYQNNKIRDRDFFHRISNFFLIKNLFRKKKATKSIILTFLFNQNLKKLKIIHEIFLKIQKKKKKK